MLARRRCSYRCRGQKEKQEQHLASIGSAYGQSPNWNPCRQMCLASRFLPEWLMLSVKRQLCDRSKVSRGVEPNKRNTHVFLLGQLDYNKTAAANDEHLL